MDAYVTQVFESSNLVLDNPGGKFAANPRRWRSCLQQGTTCKSCRFAQPGTGGRPGHGCCCPPVQDQGGQVQVQRWLTAPSAAGHSMVDWPVDARHTLVAQAGAPATAGILFPCCGAWRWAQGVRCTLLPSSTPRCWQRFSMIWPPWLPTGTRVLLVRDDGQALVQVNLSVRVQAPQAAASESA